MVHSKVGYVGYAGGAILGALKSRCTEAHEVFKKELGTRSLRERVDDSGVTRTTAAANRPYLGAACGTSATYRITCNYRGRLLTLSYLCKSR